MKLLNEEHDQVKEQKEAAQMRMEVHCLENKRALNTIQEQRSEALVQE